MDKIEIIQNGDVYSCDIGISKEECSHLAAEGLHFHTFHLRH